MHQTIVEGRYTVKKMRWSFLLCILLSGGGCSKLESSSSGKSGEGEIIDSPAEGEIITVKVEDIRYTQESIGPNFTLPDGSKGENLRAVVDLIKNGEKQLEDFPTIRLFKWQTEAGDDIYFSLDNRRLYIAKESLAGVPEANIQGQIATLEDIKNEAFKFTSQEGGFYVKITNTPDKELKPKRGTDLYYARLMAENWEKHFKDKYSTLYEGIITERLKRGCGAR